MTLQRRTPFDACGQLPRMIGQQGTPARLVGSKRGFASLLLVVISISIIVPQIAWAQGPCTSNKDCPSQLHCYQGGCTPGAVRAFDPPGKELPSCKTDADCEVGWKCTQTPRRSECQWPRILCKQDSDCPYGRCEYGSCAAPGAPTQGRP
jgi:hypothetical protein